MRPHDHPTTLSAHEQLRELTTFLCQPRPAAAQPSLLAADSGHHPGANPRIPL
jgi:hypothetical protein